MKKETGGLLIKRTTNDRNDTRYQNTSSHAHSKSPSHNSNYLNVSKSKNQFSQSQIDRSYTNNNPVSSSSKTGYSSNNPNMISSTKYRDKSMPGSSSHNYVDSQASYSSYANYKDARSKSRDLSAGKNINPAIKKSPVMSGSSSSKGNLNISLLVQVRSILSQNSC